jgi:NADPH-dependent curcumin reductase CurA
LAKARGCRTVGIAGGPDKCKYAVDELGFDACIDYKQHKPTRRSLSSKALKDACPDGIDGYFENVGGMVLDAVLLRMNAFGRIALCGMIAGYDGRPHAAGLPGADPDQPPQDAGLHRQRAHGSLARSAQGTRHAGGHRQAAPARNVAQGIEAAPEAFLGLLKGKNFGKQLVKLI